jgi:hypothetical protein
LTRGSSYSSDPLSTSRSLKESLVAIDKLRNKTNNNNTNNNENTTTSANNNNNKNNNNNNNNNNGNKNPEGPEKSSDDFAVEGESH